MGHLTLSRAAVVALLLACPLVDAGDAGIKSPKAKAALRKYDVAVERAKADYDRAVAVATKELTVELDLSLKAAMKAGNLEEAKRLEAVKVEQQPSRAKLLIRQATYGVRGSEVDISEIMRSASKTGIIRDLLGAVSKIPDPAPGQLKTITIIGTYGGTPFALRSRDGVSFGVEFGSPSE